MPAAPLSCRHFLVKKSIFCINIHFLHKIINIFKKSLDIKEYLCKKWYKMEYSYYENQ